MRFSARRFVSSVAVMRRTNLVTEGGSRGIQERGGPEGFLMATTISLGINTCSHLSELGCR